MVEAGCIAQKRIFLHHYSYLGTPARVSRTRAVHTTLSTGTHRAAHLCAGRETE